MVKMNSYKKKILFALASLCLVFILAACVTIPDTQQKRKKATRRNCIDCHNELSQRFQKGVIHAPVKENNCAACHLPHGIIGKLLMREYPPDLCFRCHNGMRSEMRGLSVHQPVEKGDCVVCHDPHNSDYAKLMKAEGNEACFACHDKQNYSRANIHNPVIQGCMTFHEPHKSDIKPLLIKEAT